MSNEAIILQPIGVTKFGTDRGYTYYQIIGESGEQKFFMTFAVLSCYEESTDKVFKRFNPIKIKEKKDEEESEESIAASNTTDAGANPSSSCTEQKPQE
jgi:hypothetical protein